MDAYLEAADTVTITVGASPWGMGAALTIEGQVREYFGSAQARAMRRFAVWQKGALRPCDNGRSSLHNDCTDMCETITCETADFPVRAALEFDRLLRAAGAVGSCSE